MECVCMYVCMYECMYVVGLFFPAVLQIELQVRAWVPHGPVLEERPQSSQGAPQ